MRIEWAFRKAIQYAFLFIDGLLDYLRIKKD